ncbi:helix-turn-helix domain-containing protein [Allokutzneria sp. A3M-2-11 16]|uniref:helix-turn-helix domain-containing protein n=1 Tax=Allokutzneria sp. A3M-2-11 16 TaxID=2962043 RepID=UPI0020B65F62|nr:helix-turn-helix transcriptional regulator [Allokutzneria sp. A3M-2-11 16]MCP3797803.1 helix-turn-helix domain-containing protein [Allokutzneria sp. A3M-2-11 16]
MTVLLREALGDRLRRARTDQRRTLREVSRSARVSLGYLSEVERGRKEASSELLAAICGALDLPLSDLLGEVAADIRAGEPVTIPAPSQAKPEPKVPVGAEARADRGVVDAGSLVPAIVGNDLSDLRLQPVLRTHLTTKITNSAPRGVVVAA